MKHAPQRRRVTVAVLAAFALESFSCIPVQAAESASSDPCASKGNQVAGAIIGGLLGGLLGNQVGKGNGRKLATLVGLAAGAAVGNHIGAEIDRRKCALARIAQEENLKLDLIELDAAPRQSGQTAEKVGLSVSVADLAPETTAQSDEEQPGNAAVSAQFESGSDQLSAEADASFRKIAAQYGALFSGRDMDEQTRVAMRDKRVLIVGHTDDTGSSHLNAELSEKARAAGSRAIRPSWGA